jgi:hypothetical protein
MNKQELTTYLVNLHALIEAQSKGAHSVPSVALGEEYEKHWKMLKDTVKKEHEEAKPQPKGNRYG